VNRVQKMYAQVCKWKNDTNWNYSKKEGKREWELNSSVTYLIHCKNLCKCHNVPPPSTAIKRKKRILFQDWACSSVVEQLPGMFKALSSIPKMTKMSCKELTNVSLWAIIFVLFTESMIYKLFVKSMRKDIHIVALFVEI
jgi:hypothetical protein